MKMQTPIKLTKLTISRAYGYYHDNHTIIPENRSEEDRRLIQLETKLFYSIKTSPKTDPINTQLFYVDYVSLVKDYRINKTDYCLKNPNLKTIIFVWSRVNEFGQRNAIRKTWANETYATESSIKVLFVIGLSDNQTEMDKVLEENHSFDDILQFQLMDSYHNCTLKSIGVLRWTQFYCKSIKFLMKTDDDIMVNTKNLQLFVDHHLQDKTTVYGILAKHWGVNRANSSKWFVSKETYPNDHFPNFIVAAHLMTRDSVSLLYAKCLETLPALWLEDVYITGILVEGTAVQLKNLKAFRKLDWIKMKISSQLFDKSISLGHGLSSDILYKFWIKYTEKGV